MIHSAKFGSIERFIGVLTEHYAGAFPAWLAPVQVDRHPDQRRPGRLPVRGRRRSCASAGIRVEVDDSDDRMQKKIRTAQKQKVPFMLIAGATDAEAGAVSFRYRDGDAAQRHPGRRRRSTRSPTSSRGRVNALADRRELRLTASAERRRGRADGRRRSPGSRTAFGRLWTPHRMAYIKGEDKPATRRRATTARSAPRRSARTRTALIVARGEHVLRRAQPVPVQLRAPDGGAVPARRRLHRPDRRRDRRARGVHPDGDAGAARGDGAARLQHRHEPGRGRRRRASPRTCTSTSCRAGAATPTSCRSSAHTRVLPQLLAETPKVARRGIGRQARARKRRCETADPGRFSS